MILVISTVCRTNSTSWTLPARQQIYRTRFMPSTCRLQLYHVYKRHISSNSFQAHFTNVQYELKRQDGRRLLKNNAVPTLFPHSSVRIRKPRSARLQSTSSSTPPAAEAVVLLQHDYATTNFGNNRKPSNIFIFPVFSLGYNYVDYPII